MLSVSFISGMAGIFFFLLIALWVGKFLFFAYKRDYKKAWKHATLFILAGIAAIACLSLSEKSAKLEFNRPETLISGDAKSVVLEKFLLDQYRVPMLEAWWWEIPPDERQSGETMALMWRYKNIFNSRLEKKCDSPEQWPEHFKNVIFPCLWGNDNVGVRRSVPAFNTAYSGKGGGLERFLIGQPVTIADAWWWQIRGADRLKDETLEQLWKIREVFNANLEAKCESRDQWPEYYKNFVVPCLWRDVLIIRLYVDKKSGLAA